MRLSNSSKFSIVSSLIRDIAVAKLFFIAFFAFAVALNEPSSSPVNAAELQSATPTVTRNGDYYSIHYSASTTPGELQLAVNYTLWIPPGVRTVRAVIVHQHGCGKGACEGGQTAAYDLHWQALAKKWHCALLGPSFEQDDKQDCRLWCDPRNGSAKTFLAALAQFSAASHHTEIGAVPWCLWGHSGGGFWSSLMQTMYPERIVAIWLRSGTAFQTWERGEIARPNISPAVYEIPVMCNCGAKEKSDHQFNGAWQAAMAMFKAYRAQGAPIGFAPDPRTAHECGDSRYLAIPFFDACLAQRLNADGSNEATKLKKIDPSKAWLALPLNAKVQSESDFSGNKLEAVWLPNATVAKDWREYVSTGEVTDTTPPPPATEVSATAQGGHVVVSWKAEADLESGIQAFVIYRNRQKIGQVPEHPRGTFGRPLFQTMSYHDTPQKPLPEMQFADQHPSDNASSTYQIAVINGAGLESTLSPPARP